MHERILKAIRFGWDIEEWEELIFSGQHPVHALTLEGKRGEAVRRYRERTAAHEAGHALMAHVVGYRVEEVRLATLKQIHQGEGGATLGYTAVSIPRSLDDTPMGVMCEVLHGLAGIIGTEVLYRDGWALDPSSWTPPEGMNDTGIKDVGGGGDVWQSRETIKRAMRDGQSVLGQRTTVDALVAAAQQAEGILEGRRPTLLRLSAALLQEGHLDRQALRDLFAVGD